MVAVSKPEAFTQSAHFDAPNKSSSQSLYNLWLPAIIRFSVEKTMINRKFFFEYARQHLFGGSLKTGQVAGLNAILDKWEDAYANKDDRWLAYALGTAHHEVGATMQPINEWGGSKYFFRMYDKDGDRPKKAAELGNTQSGDGVLFHGRGYVQLTGRSNYTKMQTKFKVDLTTDADAAKHALEPDLAAKIMFYGMENGVFTGKKFKDYFDGEKANWEKARAIINPGDKAQLVANYAKSYYAAIGHTT
jgi:putative chitinase